MTVLYRAKTTQPRDRSGYVVECATERKKFAGTDTHTVEAAGVALVVHGITIWKNVDSATFYITDGSGAADAGMPDSTDKGVGDYAGAFNCFKGLFTNGLKIVTADAAGLVFTVHYSIVEL
jgi:hypothetical protein